LLESRKINPRVQKSAKMRNGPTTVTQRREPRIAAQKKAGFYKFQLKIQEDSDEDSSEETRKEIDPEEKIFFKHEEKEDEGFEVIHVNDEDSGDQEDQLSDEHKKSKRKKKGRNSRPQNNCQKTEI